MELRAKRRPVGRAWLLAGALTGGLAAAAGCGDPGRAPASEPAQAGAAGAAADGTSDATSIGAPDPGVIPGTPPGGLADWIEDIRRGLEPIPPLVAAVPAPGETADPGVGAARPQAEGLVLDLYLGRQEFIERYYGSGGPRAAGEALDAAVLEAESRFHELLRLAGAATAPDTAEVRQAIASLERALEAVLREAERAGVPLDPPAAEARAGIAPSRAGGDRRAAARIEEIRLGLREVAGAWERGDEAGARRLATRLYLDHYEPLELEYGPGAGSRKDDPQGELARRVAAGEAAFHRLLRADPATAPIAIAELDAALAGTSALTDTSARTGTSALAPEPAAPGAPAGTPGGGAEVAAIRARLAAAQSAYRAGDTARALAEVESSYLDGFEPLEPRLSAADAGRVERLFHLELRPLIARGGSASQVEAAFADLDAELDRVERALAADATPWVTAFHAFAIIVREGLEAALLIAAILAYLAGVSARRRHRRLIYVGAAFGIGASLATWAVARLFVPVSGAGRELLEGITALVAVAVLLYVSHWLFHKAYVVDWTRYLRQSVGRALSSGSALAMAALAFAAVYREGFETVLFYQALAFESGPAPLLAGFLPGAVLIGGVGVAIVRLGVRLPLRRLFGVTNAVLLFLAFTFLGKGLYALQEAGWYAARPLGWMPDHPALRQVLGVYPVAQTLAAQAILLAFLGLTYAYYRWRARAQRNGTRGQTPGLARETSANRVS